MAAPKKKPSDPSPRQSSEQAELSGALVRSSKGTAWTEKNWIQSTDLSSLISLVRAVHGNYRKFYDEANFIDKELKTARAKEIARLVLEPARRAKVSADLRTDLEAVEKLAGIWKPNSAS